MKYLGKHFAGKKGTQLFIILFSLLIFVIGVSTFFSIPSILREGAVGSSQLEQPSSITSVSDVKNLPGVGKNPIGNANKESWSMINEIVEPDGTVVQDIVNTDGTVLTITNKQNIINPGSGSSSGGNGSKGGSGSGNAGSVTYNRNTF